MLYTKDATAEIKAVGSDDGLEEGQFRALIAVFNVIDSYGDVVMPGAFTDSLQAWEQKGYNVPTIWSHQWGDIWSHIGYSVSNEETERGLVTVSQLDLENPTAAQAYKLLKDRRITQFSFGFDVIEAGWGTRKSADGSEREVFELRKLELYETGPCLVGVNRETELQGIKGLPPSKKTSGSPRREREDGSATQTKAQAGQLLAWASIQELQETS